MHPFKKMVLSQVHEVAAAPPSVCKYFLSFDYKGSGEATFKFKYCGETAFTYHSVNLPNTGGEYQTYLIEMSTQFENGLHAEEGTFQYVSGDINPANVINYVYAI